MASKSRSDLKKDGPKTRSDPVHESAFDEALISNDKRIPVFSPFLLHLYQTRFGKQVEMVCDCRLFHLQLISDIIHSKRTAF